MFGWGWEGRLGEGGDGDGEGTTTTAIHLSDERAWGRGGGAEGCNSNQPPFPPNVTTRLFLLQTLGVSEGRVRARVLFFFPLSSLRLASPPVFTLLFPSPLLSPTQFWALPDGRPGHFGAPQAEWAEWGGFFTRLFSKRSGSREFDTRKDRQKRGTCLGKKISLLRPLREKMRSCWAYLFTYGEADRS